jgi:hypothetical protein
VLKISSPLEVGYLAFRKYLEVARRDQQGVLRHHECQALHQLWEQLDAHFVENDFNFRDLRLLWVVEQVDRSVERVTCALQIVVARHEQPAALLDDAAIVISELLTTSCKALVVHQGNGAFDFVKSFVVDLLLSLSI